MKGDIASLRADIRQMSNWLVGLYGLVVCSFPGFLVVAIFCKDPIVE
jgi:hypothetical protein